MEKSPMINYETWLLKEEKSSNNQSIKTSQTSCTNDVKVKYWFQVNEPWFFLCITRLNASEKSLFLHTTGYSCFV